MILLREILIPSVRGSNKDLIYFIGIIILFFIRLTRLSSLTKSSGSKRTIWCMIRGMQQELMEAVKGVNAVGHEIVEREYCINDLLTDRRPRKQKNKIPEDLKKQLEESFLSPPTSFGFSWLDRLQQ